MEDKFKSLGWIFWSNYNGKTWFKRGWFFHIDLDGTTSFWKTTVFHKA